MLLVFAVDEITGHAEDSAVFPLGQIASLGQDSDPEPLSEHEVTDAFSGTCGDGKRTSSEECEDGNMNSGKMPYAMLPRASETGLVMQAMGATAAAKSRKDSSALEVASLICARAYVEMG